MDGMIRVKCDNCSRVVEISQEKWGALTTKKTSVIDSVLIGDSVKVNPECALCHKGHFHEIESDEYEEDEEDTDEDQDDEETEDEDEEAEPKEESSVSKQNIRSEPEPQALMPGIEITNQEAMEVVKRPVFDNVF